MRNKFLVALFSLAFLALPLAAQTQSGTFTGQAPGSGFPNRATINRPDDVPATTKIKITKVEQQLVGGGFADITNAVTICNNNTTQPTVNFGQDVTGVNFRYKYEMDNTSPGGRTRVRPTTVRAATSVRRNRSRTPGQPG